jgi:hypothetical protein
LLAVKELIEKLQQFHVDVPVLIHGYEDGFDVVTDVRGMNVIRINCAEWSNGEYCEKEDGNSAVLISSARRWKTADK